MDIVRDKVSISTQLAVRSYIGDAFSFNKTDEAQRQHFFNNVFFPPKLPSNGDSVHLQMGCLLNFAQSVAQRSTHAGLLPLRNLLSRWCNAQAAAQPIANETLREQLQCMEPSGHFAMFVVGQNSTMTFSRSADGLSCLVTAFEVLPDNRSVMSTQGSLIVEYPHFAVTVPYERVCTEAFAIQLESLTLNRFDDLCPKTGKGEIFETRDVPSTEYVTAWLMGVLAGCSEGTAVDRISKVFRDDIIITKDVTQPWRRSGEYISLKVVLEWTLVSQYGLKRGLALYKLFMLRYLTDFLVIYGTKFSVDDRMFMMAKISRRLWKMEKRVTEGHLEIRGFNRMQMEACAALDACRASCDKWLKNTLQLSEEYRQVRVEDVNKYADIKHQFPEQVLEVIEKAKTDPKIERKTSTYEPNCEMMRRYETQPKLLHEMNYLTSSTEDLSIFTREHLLDFEEWVKKTLWGDERPCVEEFRNQSRELYNLLRAYIEKAKAVYHDDSVGLSRMFITTVLVILAMDKIAVDNWPYFAQHKLGFQVKSLQRLVLPREDDMRFLFAAECYATKRSSGAKLPSLKDKGEPTTMSPTVRYAEQNPVMCCALQEIQAYAKEKQAEKEEEVKRAVDHYDSVVAEASGLSCHCSKNRRKKMRKNGRSCCRKEELNAEARSMKVAVCEYPLPSQATQYPLPSQAKQRALQLAVICELQMPEFLGYLRDTLEILFHYFVCEAERKPIKIHAHWVTQPELTRWVTCKTQYHVSLRSTKKSFASSHYRSLPISSFREPSDYLQPCGLSVEFVSSYENQHYYLLDECEELPEEITLVQGITDPVLRRWALGYDHTQNDVLAKQSSCPSTMELSEFLAFGSLRAGVRLQLRNLVRCFDMNSLNLQVMQNFAIVSQCLWQAGPICTNPGNHLCREAHVDLLTVEFAGGLLHCLYVVLNRTRANWDRHRVLIVVILVAIRALEFATNNGVVQQYLVFLEECRAIAEAWCVEVEKVLMRCMSSDHAKLAALRHKLVDISASIALTYGCRYHKFNPHNTTQWLCALCRIHDNWLLNTSQTYSDSNTRIEKCWRQTLLSRVQEVGLFVEGRLYAAIAHDGAPLHDFVRLLWADASGVTTWTQWQPYAMPNQRWYQSTGTTKHGESVLVQVNVLSGEFLVQGRPVGRLPSAFTKDPQYSRTFGDSIFDVQPGVQFGSFVTKSRFCTMLDQVCPGIEIQPSPYDVRNSVFEFRTNNGLTILQRSSTDTFVLISARVFSGHLPEMFVERQSHWLCRRTGEVLFRPVRFSDPRFFSLNDPEHCRYVLNTNTMILTDRLSKRSLIYSRSKTSTKLSSAWFLDRLELPQYVHLWLDNVSHTVQAELPRTSLGFHGKTMVNGLIVARSREYPDMVVSSKQSCLGTLVGLKHGCLLEAESSRERRLLVPHTKTYRIDAKVGSHQVVSLALDKGLQPQSFFAYDVNEDLQLLQGPPSQSAWLFLALLHAVTSTSLPDPFLGMTGTEAALRILESGRAWSCRPMSEDAKENLQKIANLSPRRNFYPKGRRVIQRMRWPTGLPHAACHELFGFIAETILSDSKRMSHLFAGAAERDEQVMSVCDDDDDHPTNRTYISDSFLNERQYARNIVYQNLCMKSDYCKSTEMIAVRAKYTPAFYLRKGTKESTSLSRAVAQSVRTGQLAIPSRGCLWRTFVDASCSKEAIGESLEATQKIPLLAGPTELLLAGPTELRDFTQVDHWVLGTYNRLRELSISERPIAAYLISFLAFAGLQENVVTALCSAAIFGAEAPAPRLDFSPTYSHLSEDDYCRRSITQVCRTACNSAFLPFRMGWTIRSDDDQRNFESFREQQIVRVVAEYENAAALEWPSHAFCGIHAKSIPGLDPSVLRKNIDALFKRWYENKELHEFLNSVDSFVARHRTFAATCIIDSNEEFNLTCGRNCVNFIGTTISSMDISWIFNPGKATEYTKVHEPPLVYHSSQNYDSVLFSPADVFEKIDDKLYLKMRKSLEHSWNAAREESVQTSSIDGKTGIPSDIAQRLEADLAYRSDTIKNLWTEISTQLSPNSTDTAARALANSGLYIRSAPCVVLPAILPRTASGRCLSAGVLKDCFIDLLHTYVEAVCQKQRTARCINVLHTQGRQSVALARELENPGHCCWSTKDHPEWLLLELEGNFLARPLQVKIARSILNAKENTVQQLNMGEGKTTVIVPLVLSALADGRKIPRLTVLRSLLDTNVENLVWKMGGLLNRRVYIFPCRRDHDMSASLDVMHKCLEKCRESRGVIVTCPEYRLSFELKLLELYITNDPVAEAAVAVQQITRDSISDVLDESDEILHAKYQLVYTIGNQMPVDGSKMRWTVSQAVLGIVAQKAEQLHREFGDEHVEFNRKEDGEFPALRLLTDKSFGRLSAMVVNSLLRGESSEVSFSHLPQWTHGIIERFATETELDKADLEAFEAALVNEKDSDTIKKQLLTLRGLLAFGVLELALSKRYRVNYGVDKTLRRLSAVPFRAKDVAADRVEFGHVDVAITLTNTAYYNSGLTDEQLEQAFLHLEQANASDAESIYATWVPDDKRRFTVEKENETGRIPASLRFYENVNLDDDSQRDILFPFLRRRMTVVNFWLNTLVFPAETKQFPEKLSASAWDLCLGVEPLENSLKPPASNPTSGFSGTNETQLLLPLSIRQKDLLEVQSTNGLVLSHMLRAENARYEAFPSNVNATEVLARATEINATVIIDVGALILELENSATASTWLKMTSRCQFDACVFFQGYQLSTVDRNGRISKFSTSPFQTRLDRCITYLDEIHTRGTDIKFPPDSHAMVTLGKGLTKDRLVQACMRMRLLGHGHSVSFWSANDVNAQIVALMRNSSNRNREPQTVDVIRWVFRNSVDAVRSNLIPWANQGYLRLRREAAEVGMYTAPQHHTRNVDHAVIKSLCTEKEVISLEEFYGGTGRKATLTEIVERKAELCLRSYFNNSLPIAITKSAHTWTASIVKQCTELGDGPRLFTHILDEEQERELETETEEERQVERPPDATPRKPIMHGDVKNLSRAGFDPLSIGRGGISLLRNAFRGTRVLSKFTECGWSGRLVVTREFSAVLEDETGSTITDLDDYVRPAWWAVVTRDSAAEQWCVLVSPFEANWLIDKFRCATGVKPSCLRLLSPRNRRDQIDLYLVGKMAAPPYLQRFRYDHLAVEVDVFSGSTFFNTQVQVSKYCQFLGIIPRPRPDAVEAAFRAGKLASDGYVFDKFRTESELAAASFSKFTNNPVPMVLAILDLRSSLHPGDLRLSHVGPLLTRAIKTPDVIALSRIKRIGADEACLFV